MRETLNEEKEKQAQKEAMIDRFSYPVYTIATKTVLLDKNKNELPAKTGFVEAERFIDARAFACRIFGVSEVHITPHPMNGEKPTPRWQVRQFGNASNGNSIRMQARVITTNAPGHDPTWCDTREM